MDRTAITTQLAAGARALGEGFGSYAYTPASSDVVQLCGPCGRLRPRDPRLPGSPRGTFILTIPVADLPASLREGSELTHEDGPVHRVVSVDPIPGGMLTEILLTP